MSNIAGYKSIIIAAYHLGRLFPTLSIADITQPPTRVLVIGTGVAGQQAIATAKHLGGVVTAMDISRNAAEQVKALGADFVSLSLPDTQYEQEVLEKQQAIILEHLKKTDVVIASARIPGKRAPLLITDEMVSQMKPGSVIVDLAIEQKGNCELTESGKVIVRHDVTIVGSLNIPSSLPIQASQLYAKNIWEFLHYLIPDGKTMKSNLVNEILMGCLITHEGETVHPLLK